MMRKQTSPNNAATGYSDSRQEKTSGPGRRWLILAHCFNMDGRAASQTVTDRIPFLLEQGVQPLVLSAPTGERDDRFPHHRIFSASPSCFLFEVRQIINQKLASPRWRFCLKAALTAVLLPFYVLEKIFIHLDSHWGWTISATWSGWRLIKKHGPEMIYSSGGASSAHMAGFLLCRISGLPWLAELHDPLCYTHRPPRGQNARFHCWLEKIIARHSDAVVFFTQKARDQACERQPELVGKSTVIRPGANPPDFGGVHHRQSEKLHLGHFGSLSPTRNMKALFTALADLFQRTPEWRQLCKVHIYGSDPDPITHRTLTAFHLEDIVAMHGRLEHDQRTGKSGRQQILEAMRQMDILILIQGDGLDSLEYVPSKFYEYALTNRPILGLVCNDSELDHILEETGHLRVDADNPEAIAETIDLLVRRWQASGLPDLTHPPSFNVQHAVECLFRIAEEITSSGRKQTTAKKNGEIK